MKMKCKYSKKAGRKPDDLGPAFRGEHTDEQVAFIKAMQEFKKKNRGRFPAVTDYLHVLKKMGYRKVSKK